MYNSLKFRQIGKWRLLAYCLLFGFSAFAQADEPTKLLRIDKSKNDIQFLDSMYNIENVSMDQVFYVEYHDSLQTNVLKPIATQARGLGEPNPVDTKFNIPTATPVANSMPAEADKNPLPIQVQEQVKNTSSPTRSTSGSFARSSKSRSKKMKMKRVRLKKKKRSPRSSKGRCYRF